MIFGDNSMIFVHLASGMCIHFCVSEAIEMMSFEKQGRIAADQLKVSVAQDSSSSSSSVCADILDVKTLDIAYDWTLTTTYRGSIDRFKRQDPTGEWLNCSIDSPCTVEKTDEPIDFVKLKEREPILWFDEVTLFEDELHDHGVSRMTIKTRVMLSGFYCLAQFWMRLDHVAMRLYETRIHHVFGRPYVLREYTRKEAAFKDLFAAGHPKCMSMYIDVAAVTNMLTTVETVRDKILVG